MRRNQASEPEEDTWIWGNNRGGGGAPLRNPHGETVTNLRGVVNGTVEVDYSPGRRGPYQDSPAGRRRGNETPPRRGHDSDDHRYHSPIRGSEYPSAATGRGHKHMGVDDQERESRARKAREYQEQLREQVEEKKRRKETELRQTEKTKQREYDDYMKNHYKGPAPVATGGAGNRDRSQDPPSQRRDDSYREKFRREDDYDSDRNRERERDRDRDRGRSNREDPPPRGGAGAGGGRDRDRDSGYGDSKRGGGAGRGRGDSSPRDESRWVSRKEFEELQSEYEQLKIEHEELTGQLQLQEEIIEDLKRNQELLASEVTVAAGAGSQVSKGKPVRGAAAAGKRGAKGSAAAAGAAVPTGRRRGNDQQDAVSDSGVKPRSHSTRSAAAAAAGGKLPQVANKRARPASMHDTPKDSATGRGKAAAVEKRAAGAGGPRGGGAGAGGAGGEVSGFKKLQLGLEAKRVGPVVVTFEEDEESMPGRSSVKGGHGQGSRISPAPPGAAARGGGGRQSHLPVSKAHRTQESQELRGASEHLSIPSADMDGISDDQLDRLLMRARNARN